jgi:hypothetical protein
VFELFATISPSPRTPDGFGDPGPGLASMVDGKLTAMQSTVQTTTLPGAIVTVLERDKSGEEVGARDRNGRGKRSHVLIAVWDEQLPVVGPQPPVNDDPMTG